MTPTKRCTRCGAEKTLTAFQADSRRGDGRKARCKDCVRRQKPKALGLRDRIDVPADAAFSVKVDMPIGTQWAEAAVAFTGRYRETATWRWMNVPENAKRRGTRAWWSLNLYAKIDGVRVEFDAGGGFDQDVAEALDARLKATKTGIDPDASQTPAPFAYAGAPA